MRVHQYLFVSLILLLAGCSSSKDYYIEPELENAKKPSSLLVVPIQQSWFENNYSHSFGQLSGNARNIFYSSLEGLMSDKLRSKIRMIDKDQIYDGKLFKSTSLKFDGNSYKVMLPTDDLQFDMPEYKPELVLLLDQYFYYKRKEATGGLGYAGHEAKTQNILYFETKYIYWDTSNDKAVAWGSSYASKKVSNSPTVNLEDYRDVLSKAVDKVIKQGPAL
jgi:hypothetical protein